MEHDWTFIATIPVTRKEIDRALAGETLHLKDLGYAGGGTGIRESFAGCYRCEQQLSPAMLNEPCPGEPTEYDRRGVPHHG